MHLTFSDHYNKILVFAAFLFTASKKLRAILVLSISTSIESCKLVFLKYIFQKQKLSVMKQKFALVSTYWKLKTFYLDTLEKVWVFTVQYPKMLQIALVTILHNTHLLGYKTTKPLPIMELKFALVSILKTR